MNSSLGQIIVRIKQASNDIVVKRKRLEDLKIQIKNTVNSIERENLKRKEIEAGLKKSKVELIEAKSYQTVHILVSSPAVIEVIKDQSKTLTNLTEKVELAKLKVQNTRQDCFDYNATFMQEAPKREKSTTKVVKEQIEISEKKLKVLKAKKEEFVRGEVKQKKYETSITKTNKLNDLMKEKISDMSLDIEDLKGEVQSWKNRYAKAQEELRNVDFKLNGILRSNQQQNCSLDDYNPGLDQLRSENSKLKLAFQQQQEHVHQLVTQSQNETGTGRMDQGLTTDFVPASSLLEGQRKFKFRKRE